MTKFLRYAVCAACLAASGTVANARGQVAAEFGRENLQASAHIPGEIDTVAGSSFSFFDGASSGHDAAVASLGAVRGSTPSSLTLLGSSIFGMFFLMRRRRRFGL